jgi:hypothetical protein
VKSSNFEALAFLGAALIGFLLGGVCGLAFQDHFFPGAWVGLAIALGVCVCGHWLDNCDLS